LILLLRFFPVDTCFVRRVSRTIVAAPTCNVHRGSLLNLVRTCYNVHLKSKAPDNSHQASLQQMLEIVFARLPSDAVEAQRNAAAASSGSRRPLPPLPSPPSPPPRTSLRPRARL
jgi:hypothetical protein